MEDGVKVHKGYAKLWWMYKDIKGFDQLPSSPDLNTIEKVQRQMKYKISKLECVPTSIEDIKEVLRELWEVVKPKD